MKTKLPYQILIVAACSFAACDDDEKPKTAPIVTTTAVTNITTTTASGGGEIIDNGNATVTASGLAYSSTNAMPTVTDSKTVETDIDGAFSSELTGLTSGTTYHVRAYATNSVGTSYGNVVDFTTSNAAPVATNVAITGTPQVTLVLTVSYTYSDAENNVESGTTIQWYKANDAAGAGETPIANANSNTYALVGADESKFIRVGIVPKANAGTTPGVEVKSAFVGPIVPEPTTVTFTYSGSSVTYGIIISSVTGRRWLDRNLGAPAAASSYADWGNYGDSFQWGRGSDGHQLVNRGSTSGSTTGVNGTETTLSSTDSPGHNKFILSSTSPFDWRTPQNNNLWQGVNGINNPCPNGWRIPTIEEWKAENLTSISVAYDQLKLTQGGFRNPSPGNFTGTAAYGLYWSSTLNESGIPLDYYTDPFFSSDVRATGASCRCIKD